MQWSREYTWLLIVFLIILLLAGWFTWSVVAVSDNERLQESAANASLGGGQTENQYTDLSGNPVDLSAYLGSVLVVSSWASWCPSCHEQLTALATISAEYSDDLVVIAINRGEPATTAERYLHSIAVAEDVQLILDPQDRYYQSIGGYAMPETVVYDQSGSVIYQVRGDIDVDTLHSKLAAVLNEQN